jgi:hypothetical protein
MKAQEAMGTMVQEMHESCLNPSHRIVIIGFQIFENKNYLYKVYPPWMENDLIIFVTNVTFAQIGGLAAQGIDTNEKTASARTGRSGDPCEAHRAPRTVTASAAA